MSGFGTGGIQGRERVGNIVELFRLEWGPRYVSRFFTLAHPQPWTQNVFPGGALQVRAYILINPSHSIYYCVRRYDIRSSINDVVSHLKGIGDLSLVGHGEERSGAHVPHSTSKF